MRLFTANCCDAAANDTGAFSDIYFTNWCTDCKQDVAFLGSAHGLLRKDAFRWKELAKVTHALEERLTNTFFIQELSFGGRTHCDVCEIL